MKNWGSALAIVLLVGCTEKEQGSVPPAAGASGAPATSAPAVESSAPLRMTLDGAEHPLKSASAQVEVDGNVSVRLNAGPHELTFLVEPGPGRTYYAGNPIGVQLRGAVAISPHATLLTLEPFEPAKGAHVRGTLSFEAKVDGAVHSGAGRFDAPIEQDHRDAGAHVELPAGVPSQPLAGRLAGTPFAAGSALAVVWSGDPDHPKPYLSAVHFFADRDVGCDQWRTFALSLDVDIAESKPKRGAQPARVTVGRGSGEARRVSEVAGSHWMVIDSIAFDSRGTVSGAVFAKSHPTVDSANAVDVAGKFSAKVCREVME